jgi:hypothetical protein
MEVLTSAAPSKGGSANEQLRPEPQGQFKLLPVPMRGHREWNGRVDAWATVA